MKRFPKQQGEIKVSLPDIGMKEEASHADSKDEKNDGAPKEKGKLRKVFDLDFEMNEFVGTIVIICT